ncbi:methyltransferase domain-containing protein [Acidianus infernus]|uniref:Methyltransferase domain-containing protein n=1 Tax=Acidianus infernus TaxID=12915 RepID=A0A6A9QND1_ACIIN|nr:class I SAM-dependent methyltransferase [Acidianus infernus]MCY0874427.1 class I SAM-dependent methyltransferase [Acidianus infernus]MUM64727.1 methyltransferase domain-containing protein [Acidianus infernus]
MRFICPYDGTPVNDKLECGKGHKFMYHDGIYDFLVNSDVKGDKLLERIAPIYDKIWAPLGFFLTSFYSYNKIFKDAGEFLSSQSFLDIGTGPGIIFKYVKCEYCVGLDISTKFLSILKKKFSHVIAVRADAISLPIESASMDSVSSFLVLHMLSNPSLAIKEISRVLKPNGRCEILVLVKSNFISSFLSKWWKIELRHKDYYLSAIRENKLTLLESKKYGPWLLLKCKKTN